VRPSIHTLCHMAPEAIRVGPGACSSQWTVERTIGNLGEEIKQHSNLFANLAQRALRRSQTNALKAMVPDLDPQRTPSHEVLLIWGTHMSFSGRWIEHQGRFGRVKQWPSECISSLWAKHTTKTHTCT
jgi:hypothetical protein